MIVARASNQGWFARVGEILSDPWGEFLEALWTNLWFGRCVFGAGLLICLWFGNWSMTGLFAGLWALLEGIHLSVRWWCERRKQTE